MNYAIRFRPEVVDDLAEASQWYDQRSPGLGAEFLAECQASFDRITAHPQSVAAGPRDVRSVRLHRFTYVVHYRMEQSTVVVLAVFFGGRDPDTWTDRL